MRYLALDVGDKRTGLAVGDALVRVAAPAGVLEVPVRLNGGRDLVAAIVGAIALHGAGALVVGLPLNMDGSEGPRAAFTRALASRIADLTPAPIHFFDERLTSSAADWKMARSGLTRGQKKARRDALAAAAMLQDFLDALPRAPSAT